MKANTALCLCMILPLLFSCGAHEKAEEISLPPASYEIELKVNNNTEAGTLTLLENDDFMLEYTERDSPVFGLTEFVIDGGYQCEYNGVRYNGEGSPDWLRLIQAALRTIREAEPVIKKEPNANTKEGQKTFLWESDGLSVRLTQYTNQEPKLLKIQSGKMDMKIIFLSVKNIQTPIQYNVRMNRNKQMTVRQE